MVETLGGGDGANLSGGHGRLLSSLIVQEACLRNARGLENGWKIGGEAGVYRSKKLSTTSSSVWEEAGAYFQFLTAFTAFSTRMGLPPMT